MWNAEKVIEFVERFVKVNGRPTKFLDWQLERLIKPLYQVPRKYKRASLWIGKKAGKSQVCAILLVVFLMEQKKKNGLICASTIQQAEIIYNFAVSIIKELPNWEKYFWIRDHRKEIIHRKTESKARIISGSPRGKAGVNLSLCLVDEISDFTPANAQAVLDQLTFSTMANYDSAVQIFLSTAGFQMDGHPAWNLFQIARDVQENPALDPNHLAIVYAFPEDKLDWRNPDNWWQFLPSCPEIVPKQFYLDEYKKLTLDTLGENRFKTLLLNIWNNGSGADTWIHKPDWDACKQSFVEQDLHGARATMGIDLSRKFDLSAIVLLVEKNDKLYILPRFFCCRDGLEQKEKHDGFPFSLHAQNPNTNLCVIPGEVIDPTYIRKQILQDHTDFRITATGYDPNYFSDETRQILEFQHGVRMTEVKQTYKIMSQPTLQFERWIKTKKLVHNNNPLMNWCVFNSRLRFDGGSAMIDSRHSRARIDGVQACCIAVQRLLDRTQFYAVSL